MRALAANGFLKTESHNIKFGPRQFHSETGRRRISDDQTSAVIRNPVTVWHFDPRCRAVPCQHHVIVKIHRGQIRQRPISGLMHSDVINL